MLATVCSRNAAQLSMPGCYLCCTIAVIHAQLPHLMARLLRLQSLESLKLKEIKNGAEHCSDQSACYVTVKPLALLSAVPAFTARRAPSCLG